ncbi:MAG: PKD domain-containing protein [Janthinobacterium lividum]
MKKLFVALFSITILMLACKKERNPNLGVVPKVVFAVLGDTTNKTITIATYDTYSVINYSTDADSYSWNLGNDSIKTTKDIGINYTKSGTYTLTLTAFNKDGEKSITSRQVKVLDRVIQQLSITGITNNENISHNFNHAKVWAVVKLATSNVNYTFTGPSFNVPVIYQTPVITDFDETKVPYVFNVPNNQILNFPALSTLINRGLDGYKGLGYGLELYAQDATGTYLLSSSYSFFYTSQTGSILWPVADIQRNIFIAKYGDVSLICNYQ